ncbi:hypothetical protein TSTA_049320 [Talaromyces stipitatus ATCC 10500]|uniref:Uncharacterized protein n=1 Tax=Talaromyces stipitatus (strain ATCC 10500 / CBS 375.48 / QM 6759 / NRRL 1006) TaxID=441959 RepID=B8MLG2_TALSN|nr:uncharacterized protein TSTA_049320 [Talaromyces stipitatus ATCC 10500]EED15495.1 hypothetical protein TSTA_049320 [Talaromyces stipitatus ATCC 10500]
MLVETTHLLQRAALRTNSVDFDELADPDIQDCVVKYHFLCAWMALKKGDIKEFEIRFKPLPQEITKSPVSREQYDSMCLFAFRLAVKNGWRGLAESLMPKLFETFSILKQFHPDVLEYKKMVSIFFYALSTADMEDMSGRFNSLRSELLQTIEQDLEGPLGLFLQLEVMSRREDFDKDAFYQDVCSIYSNYEPKSSPDKAMMTLWLLYRHINVFTQDEHWLQENFVALLRLVPSPPWKHSELLHFLTDLPSALNEILVKPLSTAASNVALIIVWKYVESAWSSCEYLEAQEWCRFCQNNLFQQAAPANKSNTALMDCSFQIGDYAEVKSSWAVLSKQEKEDPTTIHIVYQVALRNSDIDTAANLLASLIELENGEHRYALASVAAAVTVCSQVRRYALRSVYELIEKYPIVLKKPVNLDLHRALIRLIVYELREDPVDAEAQKTQMYEVLTWGE